jgi:A/G-specific adenine glycosylase
VTGAGGFAQAVVAWQRRHGRHHLPWQGTRDPYRVWLSEVMLQQTQVATVIGYYERFVARFPDVATLAAASQDEVLAHWSGLGYYSRARNLHRCAGQVVAQHDGRFPRDSATLATLPGVGRSTAAAIAAFCSGERSAILDGNVKRVLARAFGFDRDLAVAANERALWKLAESLLPEHAIAAYTQGLMDLGAQVCLRRAPRCAECPLANHCVAHRERRPDAYPVKTRRLRRGERHSQLLWLEQADRLWLVQRPSPGVWAGLWAMPEFDRPGQLDALRAGWPGEGEALLSIKHVLTHLDWWLAPLRWRLPARLAPARQREIESALPQGRWFARPDALAAGLPAPIRRWLQG